MVRDAGSSVFVEVNMNIVYAVIKVCIYSVVRTVFFNSLQAGYRNVYNLVCS